MQNKPIICKNCQSQIDKDIFKKNLNVCPNCNFHFYMGAKERALSCFDKDSIKALDLTKFLAKREKDTQFVYYKNDIKKAKEKTGLDSAIYAGEAKISGMNICFAIMDFGFIGGSFGHLEGLVLAQISAKAIKKKLPLIVFTASGGARMQDNIASLEAMRLASANAHKMRQLGIAIIVVMTNPTSGGITASIGSFGNIIIAEPKSFVGFTGPSVAFDTIGEKIDPYLQRAEGALECGQIDLILHRKNIQSALANFVYVYTFKKGKNSLSRFLLKKSAFRKNNKKLKALLKARSKNQNEFLGQYDNPYELVKFIRSNNHISSGEIANTVFDPIIELHGDRISSDDKAVFAGLGFIESLPYFVVYFNKGQNLAQNLEYGFGMAKAGGYRKILRILKEAEFAKIPLICFIDTPGAYPGSSSEKENSAAAIAELTGLLSNAKIPVISFVTGQGGSGGAVALASPNNLHMLDFSFFSVISPEGCSSILRSKNLNAEACANKLEIKAEDLLEKGFAQSVIYSYAKDEADYKANAVEVYATQIRRKIKN